MDLFDYMRETKMESEAPLASRIRPRTLDEIVGQQHILAKINCFTGRSKQINSVPLFLRYRREPERQRSQK